VTIRTIRLMRIELTVRSLAEAERFYGEALGFEPWGVCEIDPAMATLLGAASIRQSTLRRGEQEIALQEVHPAGRDYPLDATAADQIFQHFALVTSDMAGSYARLQHFHPAPISTDGPQHLPARSGGATAFKFRDPDGHPLELIQFADGHAGGIDHSAIAVADTSRSIAFYRDTLGLQVAARQMNTGVEQDALDGLSGVAVEVVALAPAQASPHVELLGYRSPTCRPNPPMQPSDIAATRLVLEVSGLSADARRLIQDPDGHFLRLVPQ
jgi:catechol 2,3-dioxygenase-like lactoylglutathione lyase family enzyme